MRAFPLLVLFAFISPGLLFAPVIAGVFMLVKPTGACRGIIAVRPINYRTEAPVLTQLERTQSIALTALIGVTALLSVAPRKAEILPFFDAAAEGVLEAALATNMTDAHIADCRAEIERLRKALT